MFVWTTIELGAGIVCACIPTMRLIFTLAIFRAGPSEQPIEASDVTDDTTTTDQSHTLNHKRSIPSQSMHFAHLGVLGDTIQGRLKVVEKT